MRTAHERRLEYLRNTGRGGYIPAGPAQARIRNLHDNRMISFGVIAERTGISSSMIRSHYYGTTPGTRKPLDRIKWATANAILTARFTPADAPWTRPLGTNRRLQGMAAAGFTSPFTAALLDMDYKSLYRAAAGKVNPERVSSEFADRVAGVYDKYAHEDPVEHGVRKDAATRCRNYARRQGWVPPGCWDPQTIDDPKALPEWTGHCGTVTGWIIHERDGIPACQPCYAASLGASVELRGDVLRQARERKGISRDRMSALLGLKTDVLRCWEVGRNQPRKLSKLDPVLDFLDLTPDDVYKEIKK